MLASMLHDLNRTPGVLGSAYLDGGLSVCEMGEAIGGPGAVDLVRSTAEACAAWRGPNNEPLTSAVFIADSGRILLERIGEATLVAFAENEASAGLLRLRMRAMADQLRQDGSAGDPHDEAAQAQEN